MGLKNTEKRSHGKKNKKKNKWGLKEDGKIQDGNDRNTEIAKKKQKIKQKAFSICWKLNLEMKYF